MDDEDFEEDEEAVPPSNPRDVLICDLEERISLLESRYLGILEYLGLA
jgi:hypothetical protein